MALAPDHTLSARLRRMVDTIVDEVDLLIIVEEPFRSGRARVELMTHLWQALSDIRGPKDLLVYSRDEVARWRDTSNHVVARALREGEVLYER